MKEKLKNLETNKIINRASFYKSAVIILIALILFFSATTYVFYWGFVDYKSVIRTDEFGNKVCLVVTDYGNGPEVGEASFDGYHISYKFQNELFTHAMVLVIASFFLPLLDSLMKNKLKRINDRDTIIEKYTFNKIMTIVLLIILIILFILSTFYSISYIKYEALKLELPEGSGIWVRPRYSYDITDNGEFIFSGIVYTSA